MKTLINIVTALLITLSACNSETFISEATIEKKAEEIVSTMSQFPKDEIYLTSPLGNYRLLVMCMANDKEIIPSKTLNIYNQIDWMGFEERDLLLVEVRADTIHSVLGKKSGGAFPTTVWKRYEHANSQSAIRDKSNCINDFDFILIGKDMTMKKRWEKFVSFENLYAIIDAMPMRQYEMKAQ